MVIRSLQYGAISNVVSHVSRAATASVASGGTFDVSARAAPAARTARALLLPRSPSIAPQASVRALDLTASSVGRTVAGSTIGTGTLVLTAPAPSPSITPQASYRSFLSSTMATAATANTPLLALGASGNLSGAKSDGPSLVSTASGRTINGNPIGTAALAGIAALLACSAGTGSNPAACDGPGKGKPTKLNLTKKPETEWPRDEKTGKLTTAISRWKRNQPGGDLSDYPLSKAKKEKYAAKHNFTYCECVTFHDLPLGVLSLEALKENADELTAPQLRAALKGNGWNMGGGKDTLLKRLKDNLDDPDNAPEGYGSRSNASAAMKAKASKRKAAGLPGIKRHDAQYINDGGTYLFRIGQESKTNPAVKFVPGFLIIGAAPLTQGASNLENLARKLKIPRSYAGTIPRSYASSLKFQLQHNNGIALHDRSKAADGNRFGRQVNLDEGEKHWDYRTTVFEDPNFDPAHLPGFFHTSPQPFNEDTEAGFAVDTKEKANAFVLAQNKKGKSN